MQRGFSWRYLAFVAVTLGLALFFFQHSASEAPAPVGSKELYEYYGLRHPDTVTEQQPANLGPIVNPVPLNNAPEQQQPPPQDPSLKQIVLPLDALGQIRDTLTAEQCDQVFPDLYQAIDDSIRHWFLSQRRITPEDVDISWRSDPSLLLPGGAIRFMIYNNELRILETRNCIGALGYHERANGVLNLINRAVQSATAGGEVLPNIEAAIVLQDISDPPTAEGTHSFWTMAKNKHNVTHERLWLLPNYDFWGDMVWGSFDDAKRKASDFDAPFKDKKPSVVWRGNTFWNYELRQKLVEATANKPWADVVDTGLPENKQKSLRTSEYCKYAMTVHTEGVSYSGRLTQLLLCNSLPIVHELDWQTHYYHLLKDYGPDQNYVSVRRDFTDLEFIANTYLNNPEDAQKIIDNAIATFRDKYLTRAATSCYIRKLVKGYSSVAFEPKAERPPEPNGVRKLRGVAFEAFAQNMIHDYADENKDIIDVGFFS